MFFEVYENQGQACELPEVIKCSISLPKRTGNIWIECLEARSVAIGDGAVDILRDVTCLEQKNYSVVILPATCIPVRERRTNAEICRLADKRGFARPCPTLACGLLDSFESDQVKKMGMQWIAVMHEPVPDMCGFERILVSRFDQRHPHDLHAEYGCPNGTWPSGGGFAFIEQR